MNSIVNLLASAANMQQLYTPLFFRLGNTTDKESLEILIQQGKVSFIHDTIYEQLQELVKSLNPSVKIKSDEYPALIQQHLNSVDPYDYGVWIYYPWNQRLVHSLDEEEFIEVRTNRNKYKITKEEQDLLKTKKIGIVGLSVGQSIALTMAMERTCGEIRLADFDTAELSNLNRIRTGIHNLGLNKTIIAAREILEIDPFIHVKIFNDGLIPENIDRFFLEGGKLDLLVEVCDGLDIKIESRYKARELQVPVIMDTNDRGMLDVERFDLEPERAILHGLADGLRPDNIKGLTNEQKIPFILKMIGAETISTRLKASMIEVEQSINTWPQLASSVTLGGALTTDVSRRILLDQYHDSGRYYVDFEAIISDRESPEEKTELTDNPYLPLDEASISGTIEKYFLTAEEESYTLPEPELKKIIDAALIAPSAGNNQPWKWVFNKGVLFLFHDKYKSWSWGDYFEMGSHMGLGAALENVHLQTRALSLDDHQQLFPLTDEPSLIAAIRFTPSAEAAGSAEIEFAAQLFKRHTNRKIGEKQKLDVSFYEHLQELANQAGHVNFFYTEDDAELEELSEIIAECDKVRLLNEQGHKEFYQEIRWTREEAENTRDGVELASVDITAGEIAGFKVAGDWKAVEILAGMDQGNAFKKMSVKSVKNASGIIVFAIDDFTHEQLVNVGRVVQRAWIFANQQGIAVHPMLSPAFFFNRLIHSEGEEMTTALATKLHQLRTRFLKVFPLESGNQKYKEVFLMKVTKASDVSSQSLRKDRTELFYQL